MVSHTKTQEDSELLEPIQERCQETSQARKIIPFAVNTHKSGSHAAALLHGLDLHYLLVQEQQEVAEKITEPPQLTPRSVLVADAVPLSPRFRYDVCGKITGDVVA